MDISIKIIVKVENNYNFEDYIYTSVLLSQQWINSKILVITKIGNVE